MPARNTRQEARVRILAVFSVQLDRMIPEDEEVPLKGLTFADFEDQVEALAREALPVCGIIIAAEITPKLEAAAKTNPNVRLVEYAVRLELSPKG